MEICKTWRVFGICLVFLFINPERARSSQEIMTKLTIGFSKALKQCQSEITIPDHIMKDFENFWREEYDLVNRDLGCVILCLAQKFDMVTEESTVHHTNAEEFARKHGADDQMVKQLLGMVHDCEAVHTREKLPDDCTRVLEFAKCFRTKIHEIKWAPSMEVVLEEVMLDMQNEG